MFPSTIENHCLVEVTAKAPRNSESHKCINISGFVKLSVACPGSSQNPGRSSL